MTLSHSGAKFQCPGVQSWPGSISSAHKQVTWPQHQLWLRLGCHEDLERKCKPLSRSTCQVRSFTCQQCGYPQPCFSTFSTALHRSANLPIFTSSNHLPSAVSKTMLKLWSKSWRLAQFSIPSSNSVTQSSHNKYFQRKDRVAQREKDRKEKERDIKQVNISANCKL